MPLLYGSLFSGIGGFDLGFDRAGMRCAWQVELDPYCRKVLTKHWPDVPKHDDIRTFKPTPVDVICGGFPCQDISNAGPKTGIGGERSGLWGEYVRIIRTVRPRFVVVENVAALLVRGMGTVLRDLAESGYDAEWSLFSACRMGAPHMRKRVFIVAYAEGERFNTCGEGPEGSERFVADRRDNWRAAERGIVRVAYGVPGRMDRVRGCGNAVVPDIAEWIGRRLIESV